MKSTLRYIGGPEMPRSKSRAVVKSRVSDGSSRCPTPGGSTHAPASSSLRWAETREPRFMLIAVCHCGSTWSSTKQTDTSASGAARPSSSATASTRRPVATANTDGSTARSASTPHQTTASGRSACGSTGEEPHGPALPEPLHRSLPLGGGGPGSGPPYQWASSDEEIETPRGTCISPAATASRNCSRVNHRAVLDLGPVDVDLAWTRARATKPSIRLAGSGHGWLPK